MWKTKLVVLVLASVVAVAVEGAADPDPRGFTEDPLDTEEKFRENGKTERQNRKKVLKNCLTYDNQLEFDCWQTRKCRK